MSCIIGGKLASNSSPLHEAFQMDSFRRLETSLIPLQNLEMQPQSPYILEESILSSSWQSK